MDESLRRSLCGFGLAACCLLLAARAGAADLPDPTRPPAAAAVVEGVAAAIEQQPVLQSVIISPTRRVAIISGQTVALGAMYRGARLVKVSEGEAVLRDGKEIQTLKLFPDLQKQPLSGSVTGRRSVKPDTRIQRQP